MGFGHVTPCAYGWLVWVEGAGSLRVLKQKAKPLLDGIASRMTAMFRTRVDFDDPAGASKEGVGPHLLLALYACILLSSTAVEHALDSHPPEEWVRTA